jgi:hypothetical protein
MEQVDTTVFLPSEKGFIKVIARPPGVNNFIEVTIAISDILSYYTIPNNIDYSKMRCRAKDQDGNYYELTVKGDSSLIEDNIKLRRLPTDLEPENK